MMGIPAAQYWIRITSFYEVSEGAYSGTFWEEDPQIRIGITVASILLIGVAAVLLGLVHRSARPRLRTALLVMTVLGSLVVVGAVGYQVVAVENAKRQVERGT